MDAKMLIRQNQALVNRLQAARAETLQQKSEMDIENSKNECSSVYMSIIKNELKNFIMKMNSVNKLNSADSSEGLHDHWKQSMETFEGLVLLSDDFSRNKNYEEEY